MPARESADDRIIDEWTTSVVVGPRYPCRGVVTVVEIEGPHGAGEHPAEDLDDVLEPVVIGDGVRLRSHISLLAATPKGTGEYLLKTCHEVEVEGLSDKALYAEYLTYWYPKSETVV